MIDAKSNENEIEDLQRILLEMRLLEWDTKSEAGIWGRETDEAVRAGYARLGWAHAADEKWISTTALTALCTHWISVTQSFPAQNSPGGCCGGCTCGSGYRGWTGGGNMASGPGWTGGGNMASGPGWTGGGNMASGPGWTGGGNMASGPGWTGGNMASGPGWTGGGNMASGPGWAR